MMNDFHDWLIPTIRDTFGENYSQYVQVNDGPVHFGFETKFPTSPRVINIHVELTADEVIITYFSSDYSNRTEFTGSQEEICGYISAVLKEYLVTGALRVDTVVRGKCVSTEFSIGDIEKTTKILTFPRVGKKTKVLVRYESPFRSVKSDLESERSSGELILGLSVDFDPKSRPIHGLRHPQEGNTSGWYIWTGDYREDDDFFKPVHIEHLKKWCPEVYDLLGLEPGYRFLLGHDGYLDIWRDSKLLEI